MEIFEYFHKSRMLYGMCNFVDLKTPMIKLESCFMSGLKNILGLPLNTSNARVKLALGMPDLTLYLKLRLIKNMEKYVRVFGEECTMYAGVVKSELESKLTPEEHVEYNMRANGLNNGVIVGPNLKARLKNEMYTWFVSRDHLMLRYMCNRGFFRYDILPRCQHCGGENSREHATDECEWYRSTREEFFEKINARVEVGGMKMSEIIMKYYFDPGEIDEKTRKSVNRYLKEFVYELYTKQDKKIEFKEAILNN